MALVEGDGVGENDTGFVLNQTDPSGVFRKRRGQIERRISVAGVLEAEIHQTVVVRTDRCCDQRNGGGQGHAELLTDGEVHAEASFLTQLGAACIGEPEVPILLLDVSACRHRQVGPKLNGFSRTERGHDHVGAVVVAAFDVHANDGVGHHPRVVGHVGLHSDGGGRVAVVGQRAVECGHLIGCNGVAVERVVALHVHGVVGDSADAKMDEVIDVETLAGHAAVRREQHAEGVRASAEEHLGIGKVGDLFPRHLGVP